MHAAKNKQLPEPASEPTSTLVLTSPGQRFVDIRLTKVAPAGTPPYWAVAGETYKDGQGNCRWVHAIDSRQDEPGEDTGTMKQLEDGDWFEEGEMVDFDDGKLKKYEEVWRDLTIKPTVSVVLDLRTDTASGRVVRVGGYCQGIIKVSGVVTCERWAWNGRVWEMAYRNGPERLPCEIACTGDYEEIQITETSVEVETMGSVVTANLKLGEKVECGGHEWVVTEESVW